MAVTNIAYIAYLTRIPGRGEGWVFEQPHSKKASSTADDVEGQIIGGGDPAFEFGVGEVLQIVQRGRARES